MDHNKTTGHSDQTLSRDSRQNNVQESWRRLQPFIVPSASRRSSCPHPRTTDTHTQPRQPAEHVSGVVGTVTVTVHAPETSVNVLSRCFEHTRSPSGGRQRVEQAEAITCLQLQKKKSNQKHKWCKMPRDKKKVSSPRIVDGHVPREARGARKKKKKLANAVAEKDSGTTTSKTIIVFFKPSSRSKAHQLPKLLQQVFRSNDK